MGRLTSKCPDRYEEKTGNFVPIHVDAASGGFFAPFATPEHIWDFRIPRVVSINSSGHKYGLAYVGVGWVIFRDKAHLPQELIFELHYLGNVCHFLLLLRNKISDLSFLLRWSILST